MGRKLEDKVEAAVNAKPDQFSSIWMVDVSYDPKLRQEIANSILIFLVFLCYPLHRDNLTIR